jgi:transforming growth factor-beta-induced protein
MTTVVDIAAGDKRFSTLVTALKAADLVDTLKGQGPFTIFAPTDEAFSKLPPGTVESLLKDTPTLKQILLYHVVSGKNMARDAVQMNSADTVSGKSITIQKKGNEVMINDARVVTTDIEADNGVIHVIDHVLMPPES